MEDGYDPGYQLMSDQEMVETIMLDRDPAHLMFGGVLLLCAEY